MLTCVDVSWLLSHVADGDEGISFCGYAKFAWPVNLELALQTLLIFLVNVGKDI